MGNDLKTCCTQTNQPTAVVDLNLVKPGQMPKYADDSSNKRTARDAAEWKVKVEADFWAQNHRAYQKSKWNSFLSH